MSSTSSCLRLDDDNGVRTLTLSRPEKLNALGRELIEALTVALHDAEDDAGVQAVVLGGCDKAFSAGVDLKETSALKEETEIVAHAGRVADLFLAIPRMTKPTFAAVEGYALGGGCGLALACDFLIASNNAVFGYPEIKKGVMPALVTPNLVKRVGPRRAFEFLASGKQYSAEDMFALGLVSKVVAVGEALGEAQAWAAAIKAHDPRILAWIKELTKDCENVSLEDGLGIARRMNARARLELRDKS
ncbi:enoyl-CoA hydratase/isomerase family protein [Thalassospiraceae bacterium LMO-JJ14]|nr:enoyl-CoA hydratase/isomerase family protein [Thalassospiraceae bacterium LMO-JJ14]